MDEVLKKLPSFASDAIKRTLETLHTNKYNNEEINERIRWRIYGMADILLMEKRINTEDYCTLIDPRKW